MYDCHMHSKYSFDGKETIESIVEKAIKKGLSGITITDHTLVTPKNYEGYEHIEASFEKVQEIKKKYEGKILVLAGAERGDENPPEEREEFYDLGLDCILGSVHTSPLFRDSFSDSGYRSLDECVKTESVDFLKDVVRKYYDRLINTVYNADVDVIAHITFPLRYINGLGNRGFMPKDFYKEIDAVLEGIIKTGKALEVNTSQRGTSWNEFMPSSDVLKRYFDMGGRAITLGSDAHRCENIGKDFDVAKKMLKDIGFLCGSYFVKRERKEYKL